MKKIEVGINLGNRTSLQDFKTLQKDRNWRQPMCTKIAIQDRKTDDEGMTCIIPSDPRTKRTIETLR